MKIKMQKFYFYLQKFFPAAFMLLIVVISFNEIAFFSNPMKHDAIDCTLPWKYFISNCFADGVFPFWNPYQHLGYPFYGDAQNTLWYPITLLIAWIPGYSLKALSLDFIFHVWMGGVGMFLLGKALKFKTEIALVLAISYALSGFFVGNAQHTYWIVSATWLPFVINYYLKTINTLKIRDALITTFFLFLMISGGYPAFVIILAYIFFVGFFILAFKKLKNKELKSLKQFVFIHLFIAIVTIGLSFTQVVSVLDNLDFSSRGSGLGLSQILFNPFSSEAIISFLMPLMSVKSHVFASTDVSMGNGYFGILLFVFFILFLFRKKSSKERFILYTSLFCLIAALGEKFFLREFLYNYLPLMDTFRFPSAFRLFVIFGFILSAGFYLNNYFLTPNKKTRNNILLAFSIAIIVFILINVDNRVSKPEDISLFIKELVLKGDQIISVEEIAFVQSAWNIALLSVFMALFILIKKKRVQLYVLILFVIIDLGVATQLNSAYTIHNPNRSFEEMDDFAKENFVDVYPLPDMNKNVIHHSDTSSVRGPGFWRNVNNFYGQFAYDGFSSYINSNINLMEDSLVNIYRCVLSHKPIYLSNCVLAVGNIDAAKETHNCDYADITNSAAASTDYLQLISFNPNRMEAEAYTENRRLFVFLQSYHKYWEVEVNGEKADVVFVNHFHMGVLTKAGNNTIVFSFKPKKVKFAFLVTIGFWLLFFVLLFIDFLQRRKSTN